MNWRELAMNLVRIECFSAGCYCFQSEFCSARALRVTEMLFKTLNNNNNNFGSCVIAAEQN